MYEIIVLVIMAGVTDQQLPLRLGSVLDEIGFSLQRIKERQVDCYKRSVAQTLSTRRILKRNDIQTILVGSMREGVGLTGYSDTDIFQIYKSYICVENTNDIRACHSFRLDQNNVPAGYAKLKLLKPVSDKRYDSLRYAFTYRNRVAYLSSKKFMTRNDDIFVNSKGYIGRNTRYLERKGPSIPKHVKPGPFEKYFCQEDFEEKYDFVRALPCVCKRYLEAFCNRPRRHDWPWMDTVNEIASLPVHVVPVGKSFSKDEDLQWRLSFTHAEILLVESFNETQLKCLVLMKMIAKYILEPISPSMNSYLVKNVVFWISERCPLFEFRDENLLKQVMNSLMLLKQCVEESKLDNYMLPERNLLDGKLSKQIKRKLIKRLLFIVQNGSSIIYKYLFTESAFQNSIAARSLLKELYSANVLDKYRCCNTALMSSDELTRFMEKSYHSSYLRLQCYNILTRLKHYWKFGFKNDNDLMKTSLKSVMKKEFVSEINKYKERTTFIVEQVMPIKLNRNNMPPKDVTGAASDSFFTSRSWHIFFVIQIIVNAVQAFFSFYGGRPQFILIEIVIFQILSVTVFYLKCAIGCYKTKYKIVKKQRCERETDSVCKLVGLSDGYKMVLEISKKQMYERKTCIMETADGGFIQVDMVSLRLWRKQLLFIVVFLLDSFVYLVYFLGEIGNGFMFPIVRKVINATCLD